MNKQTILILSIVSLALVIVGTILKGGGGAALEGIGGLASLVTWILGIVKTAQIQRWGWLVAVVLLGTLGTLIYGIAGPDQRRVG